MKNAGKKFGDDFIIDECYIRFLKNKKFEFSWFEFGYGVYSKFYFKKQSDEIKSNHYNYLRQQITYLKHPIFIDQECTIPLILDGYQHED